MTTIICPHGFGETDRSRCLDRVPVDLTCLHCPVLVVLIADSGPGADAVNAALAARLPGLLARGRKPAVEAPGPVRKASVKKPSTDVAPQAAAPVAPDVREIEAARERRALDALLPGGARASRSLGSVPVATAVAACIALALRARPRAGHLTMTALAEQYGRIKRAPVQARGLQKLRRALRRLGLSARPVGGGYRMEIDDTVRAFVRANLTEAA